MHPDNDYETCTACGGDGMFRIIGDGKNNNYAFIGTGSTDACVYCDGLGTIPTVETFRKAVSQFLDRYGEVGAKDLAKRFAPALAVFLPDVEPHQTLRRRVMHWMVLYSEKAA